MLKKLSIHQFAIIEDLTIEFHPGFTVLTGETGAGKSILIDAISLLLGDRASQEMIRSGKEYASVEAVFTYENDQIEAKLAKLGIDTLDHEIMLSRTISMNNKNTIKINQKQVTLQDLNEITKHLADIHSQFDTQRLINPQNYIELVDGFAKQKMERLLEDYRQSLSIFRVNYKSYQSLLKKKDELLRETEKYTFQFEELSSLDLTETELDDLRKEEMSLLHFDQIYHLFQEMKSIFDETEYMRYFYEVIRHLEDISSYDSNFSEDAERISGAYYEMEDFERKMSKHLDQISFDPEELEAIQSRIHLIEKTMKKYQMTVSELIAHLEWLRSQLDQSENYDEYVLKALDEVKKSFQSTLALAKEISLSRKYIAKKIEKDIMKVLSDLVLPNTDFEIVVDESVLHSFEDYDLLLNDGINHIELMISTNVGEPKKPLSKTASGGEMSRIMLAFKAVFIKSQNLSTIVFDEIDTGISGAVATQIAKKMKELSSYAQVLSITHIPQVVAYGDYHIHVQKKTVNNRTFALTKYLEFNERVEEIAHMISGDKLSNAAIESAKELLMIDSL